MEYQELITVISERSNYTPREIRQILRLFAEITTDALSQGLDVQVQRLGRFKNVASGRRSGRDSATGKRFAIPPARRVKFEPTKPLRSRVKASMRLFDKESLATKYGLPKRRNTMEKYGVQIDPDKVPKEKKAGAGNKDPHPNTNIPLDPNKGSEPYERRPDGEEDTEAAE